MNTVEMKDIDGNTVLAEVGDTIAAYCYLHQGIVTGKIERIKNGFQACNLKVTPKASKCLFIKKAER
jgi:hypothetical protein